MRTPHVAPVLAALALAAGCASPTRQRVCNPEPLPRAHESELPAPQAMVATPTPGPREQQTIATISEEERTEMLRAVGSPIRPYTPPVQVSEPPPAEQQPSASYDGQQHSESADGAWCNPLGSLVRIAAYTGMGAIIGHQFHERGQGAAIGAGLAFLTTPWFNGHGWGCWDH